MRSRQTKRAPWGWWISVGAFSLSLIASAQIPPSAAVRTIDVGEIRPGMRGYGLTVFRGTTPERFDVEVVDVLHNFRPDQDLILVRCIHPILDHATTVGGMSGSPIFLEDKLAGAYAYGWTFGKDPIAGVTPIANMLREMRRPTHPSLLPGVTPTETASAPPSSRRLADFRPWRGSDTRTGAVADLRGWRESRSVPREGSALDLEPATTPLLLGGFADGTRAWLERTLGPLGLMPVQAGGGARPSSPGTSRNSARFVDGGAIGVQLVRGDVSVTGVGTVTYVQGGKAIAFGHPMMNAGEVGLPTATARVLHILASTNRSFKIAEALDPVGTLTHDRQSAIVIDQDRIPATVPVTLHIRGVDGAPRDTWRMEVASHRMLTPALVLGALSNALEATVSDPARITFTATGRVQIEGHGTHQVTDVGYTAQGIADEHALGGLRVFDLLRATYGNAFEEARITNVDLDLSLQFGRETSEIIDANVRAEEADPGETVNVNVVLRKFGQAPRRITVPVRIPESAAGSEVELTVQAGDDVTLEHPEPESLDDVLEIAKSGYTATTLVVSTRLPSRGLRFRGHIARSLPGSAFDALSLANDSALAQPLPMFDRTTQEIGEVLTGSARLRLRVRATRRN